MVCDQKEERNSVSYVSHSQHQATGMDKTRPSFPTFSVFMLFSGICSSDFQLRSIVFPFASMMLLFHQFWNLCILCSVCSLLQYLKYISPFVYSELVTSWLHLMPPHFRRDCEQLLLLLWLMLLTKCWLSHQISQTHYKKIMGNSSFCLHHGDRSKP